MHLGIISLGPYSWSIESKEQIILINPRLENYSEQLKFLDNDFKTIDPKSIWSEKPLTALITSHQYQYLNIDTCLRIASKFGAKFHAYSNVHPEKLESLQITYFGKGDVFEIGDIRVAVFGPKTGSTHWDNEHCSLFIEALDGSDSAYFQLGSTLDTEPRLPKAARLNAVTFNMYSAIKDTSCYQNSILETETYSASIDLQNFLNICNSSPVATYMVITGSLAYNSEGEHNFRMTLKQLVDYARDYLVNCDIAYAVFGQDYRNNINFSVPSQPSSWIEPRVSQLDSDQLDSFLTRLSQVIMLTSFGREMFGLSQVNGRGVPWNRFVLHITSEDDNRTKSYAFDMRENNFVELSGKVSLKGLMEIFPFGIKISENAVVQLISGQRDIWPLLSSMAISQWFVCAPESSPVIALFCAFNPYNAGS